MLTTFCRESKRILAYSSALSCLTVLALSPLAKASAPGTSPATFDVTTFGAKGDGMTRNTLPIQAAIDAASKAGGGVVLLPAGQYLSGSLQLKSHVELRLDRGATLRGSTSRADYPHDHWSALLMADRQEDIKVSGQGTIDGQGVLLAKDVMRRAAQGEFGAQSPQLQQRRLQSLQLPDAEFSQKTLSIRPNESDRPMVIKMSDCHDIEVSGVTIKNSSSWVEHYERCDGLVLKDLRVDSTTYWNNDGIDINDCRNVKISGCDINSADDGICLKSGASGALGQGDANGAATQGCYNVDISDCRVRSSASAFKMGTASFGGFRKIHLSNMTVRDTYRSAVALESVDGGTIDDVVIENVTAVNTGSALFMRLGQRNRKAPPGVFQNVTIRNLNVQVAAGKPDKGYDTVVPSALAPNVLPAAIVGIPGHPIRNVRLENIQIVHPGGGDAQRVRGVASDTNDRLAAVPENVGSYPEISMFGELPVWGLYVRHAEGVQLINVQLDRTQADYRPALTFDDVHQLALTDLRLSPAAKTPDLFLQNVQGAMWGQGKHTNVTSETIHVGSGCSEITGPK